MAIAYDSSAVSNMNSVTTNSFSHTCTGSNLILFVGVQFATGTDISGVPTYSGVNMIPVTNYSISGTTFNNVYLYYLTSPTTGSNTVSINNTGVANYIYACSASYTGVAQSSPIDVAASTFNTSTSVTKSVTTTVNNDWLVSYTTAGTSTAGTLTAGSNTTQRKNGSQWNVISDSNAAQTPAGSYGQTTNSSASELIGIIVAALKPFVANTAHNLSILGVGV
jgi:hypothetical protein